MGKPSLLYVDKNHRRAGAGEVIIENGYNTREIIARSLGEKFIVDLEYDFDSETVNRLIGKSKPYEALVSHFPCVNFGKFSSYQQTVQNFLNLKTNRPDLAIVIYTGAAPKESSLRIFNPENVVFKGRDVNEDAKAIISALERLLKK